MKELVTSLIWSDAISSSAEVQIFYKLDKRAKDSIKHHPRTEFKLHNMKCQIIFQSFSSKQFYIVYQKSVAQNNID